MTQALAGLGAHIKLGSSGSSNFSTIAEVLDLTGPGETLNMTEVTNHDSTYVERIPTVLDGGEVTFDVNTLPGDATQGSTAGLRNLLRNKEQRAFRMFYSSTSSRHEQFNAYVTNSELNLPVQEQIRTSFTLTVDGSVAASTTT